MHSDLHIPRHVAIIMDGNGRWAVERGLPRPEGHAAGAKAVREVTREAARLGVRELTLYSFSTENWRRPAEEVDGLMRLLALYLVQEQTEIMDNDIQFRAIGRLDALPGPVRGLLQESIEASKNNRGLILRLALNYGGRQEICDAARALAVAAARGELDPTSIDEAAIRARLYDPEMSDPDLLVRTGGEQRLSNFLLWQLSYSELWSTPVLWPDFDAVELQNAIEAYGKRERRFGGIGS